MKYICLEIKMLKQNILLIILTSIILPVLNNIIYLRNGIITSDISSNEALLMLFGSADNFFVNWIYWAFFCVGYIVLLQVVWRPHIQSFEVYQLLRHQSVLRYWVIKYSTGFLFTCFYIFCSLIITIFTFFFKGITIKFDLVWLTIFMCLTLNFYIHALIWLTIKIFSFVEIANILIMILFYAGFRIAKPYIPLYYGMLSKLTDLQSLIATFIIELSVISLLYLIITKKAKNMDYL